MDVLREAVVAVCAAGATTATERGARRVHFGAIVFILARAFRKIRGIYRNLNFNILGLVRNHRNLCNFLKIK